LGARQLSYGLRALRARRIRSSLARSGDGLEMAIPNHQGGGNRTLILSPLVTGATQFGPLDAPLTAHTFAR